MIEGKKRGNGARVPAVDRHLHTGSFAAFKATFLPGLSLAFFGIGLYRLWYQFSFYNLHFSADMGMVTVGANIARVAVIALLVLLALFGSPAAVSSFIMAQQMDGDGDLAGQLVVLGSLCSIITMFIWIFIAAAAGSKLSTLKPEQIGSAV